MPTTAANTYVEDYGQPSQDPLHSHMERGQMAVSTTLDPGANKKFIAVAFVTSTTKLAAYNDANSPAGVGVCKGLLPTKAVSDGSGNITVGSGQFFSRTQDTVGYFVGGYFYTAEITGLDANGLADMGGHLLWGDLTTGEIVIPT